MSKLEVLKNIRAGYNQLLFNIKSEKRRKLVQKWTDEINLKILKIEEQQ